MMASINKMGSASSMLTQYDIEQVQEHCHHLFSQQEILSLYKRFCQLDRNAKGYISADEFLSVPEFAMNPLSQRLVRIVDGLNFMDFVAFLSAFSSKATTEQKIACNPWLTFCFWCSSISTLLLIAYLLSVACLFSTVIFKVYDPDGDGKVSFSDILKVLGDLSGSYMSDEEREQVLTQVIKEAGYSKEGYLLLDDFIKVFGSSGLKMEVEVPAD
ncbi:Calcineurin subunit B [Linum perenne]